MSRLAAALSILGLISVQSDDELRKALEDQVAGKEWGYDDFAAAAAAAKKSGRPILAVVR